jgi:predicted amidohydrolase
MKKHIVSRRQFLQSSTLALGALPVAMGLTDTLFAEPPSNPGAGSGNSSVPPGTPRDIYREVYQEEADQSVRRSKASRKAIEDSLRGKNARPVVLAVFQMRNHCDGEAGKQLNLEHMLDAIDRAAAEKAQIIVFPEMCLPGYFNFAHGSPAEARKANRRLADTLGESRFLKSLQEGAGKAGVVITFGFCLKEGEKYYNAIGVINSDGTWLGIRRKNPLYPWPYELESFDQPDAGERSAVFATSHGKIGISDCFDGEFPESVRRMRLAGAEMLLWSNAAMGDSVLGKGHRIHNCGCHAWVNHMWVACSNCSAENSCRTSLIVGPDGEPLVILPPLGEALGIATINLALSDIWSIWRDRLDPIWTQEKARLST